MKRKIDFEKITNFIKKKNFIITFSVFVLTISTTGVSYASFFSVKTNTTNQALTTGTLSVSFGNESSSVLKNSMTSLSNEAGMNQTDSTIVYIQNTASLNSTFSLTVGYDMDNFTSRSGYSSSDVLTPLDYVMLAVYQYNGAGKEDTLVSGPISIADLPIYSQNTSDYRYNRYLLLFNTVGSTSSASATKTYKVKMWLSDKAIPAASYTYFYINTDVVAEVENAKMAYDISGTLSLGSNTLSNAKIDVQNGSFVTTTNSSGAFTLTGLYPGTYNLNITTSDNVQRQANLTVVEGSSVALSSLGSTFSGNNIYTVAKKYGTTLSKILTKNNINSYSSAATISSGSLYPTYQLTGGANSTISGLKIVLDSSNDSLTMSL